MTMTSTLDLFPSLVPRRPPQVVTRAAAPLGVEGAKTENEARVMKTIRSGQLHSEASIAGAIDLSPDQVSVAVRSLESRSLVRRHVNALGVTVIRPR